MRALAAPSSSSTGRCRITSRRCSGPLLSDDPEGWHQLGLAASLAVIASGFTAYAWLGRLAGRRAALIGAVLYMSAPYHLAVDLYQRFAFAELWGFVWMPLVMLFARGSLRGGAGALAGLSLSYALLIMTHLPTTLLFSWVPLAYALWMAEPGDRLGPFVRVAGGMLLGMGLAAIYLLPALATQEYVFIDSLGGFFYGHHFLFNGPYTSAVIETVSRRVGLIALATAGLALLALLAGGLGRKGTHARERFFWGGVGTLAVLMMLPASDPVWRVIPALQQVQFPWRFNTVLLAVCAALVTLAFATVLQGERKFVGFLLLGGSFALCIPSILALGIQLVLAREMGTPSLDRLAERLGTGYPDLAARLNATKNDRYDSFLPRWVPQESPESFRFENDVQARWGKGMSITQGSAQIRMTRWHPPHIELAVETGVEARINLHQYFYPGWVARLDDNSTRLEVGPSSPDGLLEVKVPPGTHRILIGREPLPEERAGQVVSGVSLVLLGALAMGRRRWSGSMT